MGGGEDVQSAERPAELRNTQAPGRFPGRRQRLSTSPRCSFENDPGGGIWPNPPQVPHTHRVTGDAAEQENLSRLHLIEKHISRRLTLSNRKTKARSPPEPLSCGIEWINGGRTPLRCGQARRCRWTARAMMTGELGTQEGRGVGGRDLREVRKDTQPGSGTQLCCGARGRRQGRGVWGEAHSSTGNQERPEPGPQDR